MKKTLPFLACAPFLFSPSALAGTIMVSVVNSGDLDPSNNAATAVNYDLDTLGSIDWVMFTASGTPSLSKAGGSAISDLTVSGASVSSANSGWSPVFTWTGGDPTAFDTREDLNFAITSASNTTGQSFSLSANATTTMQSLYIFAGVSRAGGTLTASLSDGSAMMFTSQQYDVGSETFGHITYRIDFAADELAGETLDVTWTKTDSNGSSLSALRFQGAALTVPEPSSAALAGLGALLLFRRRR